MNSSNLAESRLDLTVPATPLPPSVAAKLKRIDEEIEDGQAMARGLSAAADQAREKLADAQGLLDRAQRAKEDQPAGVRNKPNLGLQSSIDALRDEVEKQRRSLDRTSRAEQALLAKTGVLRQLREAVDNWLDGLDGKVVLKVHEPEVRLPANTDLKALRKRIAGLRADIRATVHAPRSAAELAQLVERDIERLRQEGAPDFGRLIDGASDQVRWPSQEQVVSSIGVARGGGSVASVGRILTSNAAAMLAWLFPEAFAEAVHQELRNQLDGEGLGAAEREAQLRDLRKELLALERVEEAIIEREQPEEPRRADLDIRALLGLADDTPVPSAGE